MTPTPDPSPSTVLDYATHMSQVTDNGFVVLVVVGVLVLVSLGILVTRSIA